MDTKTFVRAGVQMFFFTNKKKRSTDKAKYFVNNMIAVMFLAENGRVGIF